MEIQLIYIIKSLLLPPTNFLILGIVGLLLYRKRMGIPLISVSIFGLFIFSFPFTVDYMVKTWEPVSIINAKEIERFKPQAIVVLGGGVKKAGKEYEEEYTLRNRTLIRLRYAVKLVHETGLPLLVSGGQVFEKYTVPEAKLMAQELQIKYGLNIRWRENKSRNTAENAFYSQAMLKKDQIDRIILVTHAYHMPRSKQQFEATGLKVLAAPTDFMSDDEPLNIFSFIPSIYALEKSFLITHEWLGFFWYKLRYG